MSDTVQFSEEYSKLLLDKEWLVKIDPTNPYPTSLNFIIPLWIFLAVFCLQTRSQFGPKVIFSSLLHRSLGILSLVMQYYQASNLHAVGGHAMPAQPFHLMMWMKINGERKDSGFYLGCIL
ncbi:hypothetical protein BDQ17DRAFT_209733 [Cyathus striatus]|nr:hypothetical protein BDQ17DRAFT_209733 [Cyathus striatus]